MAYPSSPNFGAVTNTTYFDIAWYAELKSQLEGLVGDIGSNLSDQSGNIALATGYVIKWDSSTRVEYINNMVQINNLEISSTWDPGYALSPAGDLTASGHLDITNLTLSGNLTIAGVINVDNISETNSLLIWQIADPASPPDQHAVIWLASGSSSVGSMGDLCIKITETTTKATVIADFSTL
jgi:hypothetical protein